MKERARCSVIASASSNGTGPSVGVSGVSSAAPSSVGSISTTACDEFSSPRSKAAPQTPLISPIGSLALQHALFTCSKCGEECGVSELGMIGASQGCKACTSEYTYLTDKWQKNNQTAEYKS